MFRPVAQGPFLKGLLASNTFNAQPKGTVPRSSNLLLDERGSLTTCDGSFVLHDFNGAVQTNRGRIMATYLFSPIGVSRYYMVLAKALDIPLGPPLGLSAALASGGSLTSGQAYFYKITALDNAGGETTASAEVTATPSGGNLSITLTWNILPNAVQYNIYRSTTTGTETLLAGTDLPVAQPAQGTTSVATVSFKDTGTDNPAGAAYNLLASPNGATEQEFPQENFFQFQTSVFPTGLLVGKSFVIAGCSPSSFNGTYAADSIVQSFNGWTVLAHVIPGSGTAFIQGGGGTLTVAVSLPAADTTQQTALFKMPVIVGIPALLPVAYNNTNIVALFPADPNVPSLDGGGGGGGGGGGRGGSGGGTGQGGGGTASGGVPNNVSLIPQFVQFTNQLVMALGNGFAPQIFSDPSTAVNPAVSVAVTSATADANGLVTLVTAAHGIRTTQVGGQLSLSNVSVGAYNGGPFVILAVPDNTHLIVFIRAAAGAAAGSGGKLLVSTVPIDSTFVPAYPTWTASTTFGTNSIIQPTASNGHYYKAIQGGTTGTSQPTFPTGKGNQVADGGVIWQEAGLTNTVGPAPPGAGHLAVYAGSLWAWNTSPTNTSNGLDGPTCLRMSDVNNATSWNPINQAFIDKDDGTEGMGLTAFTITAQGIPPQGSLVVFKNFSTYQVLGVFGAADFAIQRVKTDMGCTAPRSIQFVPGFGLTRMTHLGVAVFDGVDDRIISEEIRPYIFPMSNHPDLADITVMDANWVSISWAAQTATPPMYVIAIPIGNSGGTLTRLLCYDLVLKAWVTVDLPFSISTFAQFRTSIANAVTVMGGFTDGVIQRWQAGDTQWYGGVSANVLNVNWSFRTPEVLAPNADNRLYCRRLVLRGVNNTTATVSATANVLGQAQTALTLPAASSKDFDLFFNVNQTSLRFDATVNGTGSIGIYAITWHMVQKPVGAPLVLS